MLIWVHLFLDVCRCLQSKLPFFSACALLTSKIGDDGEVRPQFLAPFSELIRMKSDD
jgi:hypothetical protein